MLMDEPFSAVDPVVRAQLQDEFIRLQAELGKTIVFVTHDIDEAVKLGDQIAVFARRWASWPSSPTRPRCSRVRPTTSSPTSSAATAATGRCRSCSEDLPVHASRPLALGEPVPAGAVAPSGSVATGGGCWWSTTTAAARLARRSGAGGHAVGWTTWCSAARWPRRTARCARPWTRRCPRRPAAASPSTPTARSSAPSPPDVVARRAVEAQPPERRRVRPSQAGAATWTGLAHATPSRSCAWLVDHIWLALCRPCVGLLLALPLGALAHRYRWSYATLITLAGLLYTIPSLALFVVLPALLGTRILDPLTWSSR